MNGDAEGTAGSVPVVVLVRAAQAARLLGWSRGVVMRRAREDAVLVDARQLKGVLFGSRDRWYVPESWIDQVGDPLTDEVAS